MDELWRMPDYMTVDERAVMTVGYGCAGRSTLMHDTMQAYLLRHGGTIATKKLRSELEKITLEETY